MQRTGFHAGDAAADALDHMLDDYYTARGWDKNGIPMRAKLEELELKDIADDLKLV